MARSAGRERTVCESCELPYYADEEECPYCGTDQSGFVFGTAEGTDRSRTTCPDCGLPHYDGEGCPYCAYAGSGSEPATATAAEPVEPESEPRPESTTDPANDEPGFFGRLKRALGF